MRKYLLKKIILSAYFIIASFALIAITFPVMKMGVFPKYFVIDLCYILAISSILFLCPLLMQEIVQSIILIAEALILISSASLYLSRGDVFTWSLIFQIFQLATVSDAIKLPVLSLVIGIILIVGYFLICILIKKPKIQLKKFYNLIVIGILSAILVLSSGGNVLIHQIIRKNYSEDRYFSSDSYAYSSFSSSYASLQKFGFYGYYFEHFFRLLIPSFKPKIKDSNYSYEHYTSILNGLCEENNVIMIYAESFDIYGISKELTPVLYSLKNGVNLTNSGILNYYNVSKNNGETSISRKDFDYDSTNNQYSFNGTNIYDGVVIDEVGLELTNYLALESTNMSELKALTGNYDGYKYSFPQILNDDYSTNYIHGNSSSFYGRTNYIKTNIGFENARFFEDMHDFSIGTKDSLNCFTLDSETMKHYVDNQSEFNCFPTDEKFFTFLMTISTHSPYDNCTYLDKNYALIDAISSSQICDEIFNLYNSLSDLSLKNAVKEYYARILDTEYALAYIVNYLYDNNLLEKTIISFTGDHDAYGNNIKEYKSLFVKNILNGNDYFYKNIVEGFIYSTNITSSYLTTHNEQRKVTHLTESVDLAPTILTLLGKEYKQELYLGSAVINKSVSNPEKTIYNHLHRSFFYGEIENNKLVSTNGQDIISKDPNYTPTQEEIDEFINDYNYLFAKYYYVKSQR